MKRKTQTKVELEAELLRLNSLVRERRAQLERMEDCPNKECRCRAVWQEQVDKGLASQIRKIRRQVGEEPVKGAAAPPKSLPKSSPRKRARSVPQA